MSNAALFGIWILIFLYVSLNVTTDRILSKAELSAVSFPDALDDYPVDLAIDDDSDTCAYLENHTWTSYVKVTMRREQLVKAVSITVPKGIYSKDAPQLEVDVSGAGFRRCAIFDNTTVSSNIHLVCPGDGLRGTRIEVWDQRSKGTNFGLCDIEIVVKDDRILAKEELHAQSGYALDTHPGNLAIDDNPETCTYIRKNFDRRMEVDMGRDHVVRTVTITVPIGIYSNDAAQMTVYVKREEGDREKCDSFKGTMDSSILRLTCPGNGLPGKYVEVVDDRKTSNNLSLCEIQIFVKENVLCNRLPKIEHGKLFYNNKELIPGTTVNASCDHGYRESGGPLVCVEGGAWTGTSISCQQSECSTLSSPPNAQSSSDKRTQVLSKEKLEVVLASPVLSNYPVDLAIDDDPQSCTYTKDNISPRWFLFDMGDRHNVTSVTIIVPMGIYSTNAAQLSVYVYGIPMVKRWTCASFNGTVASSTLHLKCSGEPLFERFLEVMDNRKKRDNFGLCDIKIFVQ